MTNFEKSIYNKYLAVTRSSQGKPFKLRKNFDIFEDTDLFYIKKLSLFFNKFKHVDMDTFFKAPFEIYLDNKGFDLKFYTTQRALKIYTLFKQRQATAKPDTDEQLHNIKKSLQYILAFCNDVDITIDQYINHTTNNTYTFLLHLKEHKVNIYALFGYPEFEENLASMERGYLKFLLGEFIDNIAMFRTNFASSKYAKQLARDGIDRIKQIQQSS